MAMCLMMAMFSGPYPVRKRARSSWKTTSMIQCSRFSTPQWARTARAKVGASRRADERWSRRARVVLPPRSTSASTMAMAARPGTRGLPGKRRSVERQATSEPGHVMADDVAPDLDAAMVTVGRGVPVEIVRGGGKEAFDLAVQVRPVVFHRDQVVRALSLDGVGDLGLAAHGIKRDEGSGEGQALEQQRDGGDLIRLGVGGFLPEHPALTGRPGGDKMQRLAALAAVVRAPRSLAVDGDKVGLGVAQLVDPGHKAGLEERGVECVDDVVEGIVGGKAVVEGQESAQEAQVLHTPEPDFDEVLRSR